MLLFTIIKNDKYFFLTFKEKEMEGMFFSKSEFVKNY